VNFDHLAKSTNIGVWVGAGAVIIAAIIGALISIYPSLRNHQTTAVVAGIVVDQDYNSGIGQASLTVAGRDEKYVTDDSGNFRFEVGGDAPKSLRLHVSKSGYRTLDTTVTPPVEGLVLQLHKQ
jgi:hypothetical protein